MLEKLTVGSLEGKKKSISFGENPEVDELQSGNNNQRKESMKANMSRARVSHIVTLNPIYVLCWNINIAKCSSITLHDHLFLMYFSESPSRK